MVTHRRYLDGYGSCESGFTLVELMVVALIIGILVTIALPVYTRSRLDAETKSCQANQRTIEGAIAIAHAADVDFATATAGELTSGESEWYDLLIPGWIARKPFCAVGQNGYYLSQDGEILGDQGVIPGFQDDHRL